MQQKSQNTNLQSEALIVAIKATNEEVLKNLYEENYHKVENYVLANSGTRQDAKDIYQEAFISLWRNIQMDKFFPENEHSINAYLFRIAKNKWLDHLRSCHFKKTVPLMDISENKREEKKESEELSTEDAQFIIEVKKHFQELGENCQELLIRFYYKKESMRTISKQFNWTEASTRNNKYRCIQKLRDLLKK
ncbi:MAG: sigma-70 family RNA polymerase sigma factor [Ginsengibacter sp.]